MATNPIKLDFTEAGQDSQGKQYNTLEQMWNHELETPSSWYDKAAKYWESIESTDNGMLGGFASISKEDIKGSSDFLREYLEAKYGFALGRTRAIDCGAGIGRITKNLLAHIFQKVDIVEQNPAFVEKAKEELKNVPQVENFYCSGLQSFEFGTQYDLIWIQWVCGHLTDPDFINLLQRCQKSLKKNGLIVVKENNTREGFIVDKDDSSVTRSDKHLRALFIKAGLDIIKVKLQPKFPPELFPVRMYALR